MRRGGEGLNDGERGRSTERKLGQREEGISGRG